MKSIAQKASEYANNLCFSKEAMQYLSKEDFEMTFKDGAKYALEHQWINIKEQLPLQKQKCFIRLNDNTVMYSYFIDNFFLGDDDHSIEYWMPIPELQK